MKTNKQCKYIETATEKVCFTSTRRRCTYLVLLRVLVIETGSRYMVPKVPILVLEASIGSYVLDKVLLRGVHLLQVCLIDLNHLVRLSVT